MITTRKTDLPTKALYEANHNPATFAKEHLGISYQMYRYRIRQGRLTLSDYHKILHYTNKSFEDLFPNPLSTTPQPIKLNLNSSPVSRLTSVPPPQKEEKKPAELPVSSPPSSPSKVKIIDVYGGDLPADEQNTY